MGRCVAHSLKLINIIGVNTILTKLCQSIHRAGALPCPSLILKIARFINLDCTLKKYY